MDIQDMRIFARVAAVQNLSAVGTELGLTPGTISKRIQALEDELHAPARVHPEGDPICHSRGFAAASSRSAVSSS